MSKLGFFKGEPKDTSGNMIAGHRETNDECMMDKRAILRREKR